MFRLCYSFPSVLAGATLSCIILETSFPAIAQVTSAGDRTGTVVNQDGSGFAITGGSVSGDRSNLFHNFADFNLNSSQSATFFADPAIHNILSKISGGNASFLDGLIQIKGSEANLFLLNPSGIVFGSNAQLDIDGDFTASTATKIGFGDAIWQEGTDYSDLVGSPTRFYFDGTAAIINAADLEVGTGNSINLLGSNIVNTGELVAKEGNIQLIAVPGTNTLYLNQNGLILGLEVAPQDSDLTVTNLAELLTGSDLETGLSLTDEGKIQLDADQAIISPQSGVATISGTLDVSGQAPNQFLQTPIASTGGNAGLLTLGTEQTMATAATSPTGMVLVSGVTLSEDGSMFLGTTTALDAGARTVPITSQTIPPATAEAGLILVSDVTLSADGSSFIPTTGQGGEIAVFGREVALNDATLDASGENGGGEILVGGDYQGLGDRPTAFTTVVDENSVLNVSATGLGDGGTAIVWADGATWFHGTATAQGGNFGGDGGLIETSGKGFLDVTGAQVSTLAQTGGQTGTWLLDPVNLTITDNTNDLDSNIVGNPNFAPGSTAGMSKLSKSTLEAALAVNNVTVTTAGGTNDVGDFGDLSLDATINSASGNSLTLTSRGFNLLSGGFNLGGNLTFNLNRVNPITEASSLLGDSIQAAHDAIGTVAGTSTINLGAGIYQPSTELSFTKDLTLTGSGAGNTFLAGNNSHRVLSTSGTVKIGELTIQNGNALLSAPGATDGSDRGGGIYNSGTLTVTDTVFTGNRADYAGGAIANGTGGSLTVENSTFVENTADYGGGIENNLGGTATVNTSTFTENRAIDGGGIYNSGTLTVTNTTLVGNQADVAGGAIANDIDGKLTVQNSTFFGNTADYGGGIDNYEGSVRVNNSTFANNSAINGAGIANYGTTTLANSIIANSLNGGDIFNANIGTLTLAGSNLLETGSVSGNGTVNGGIILSGDPLLSDLGDYGGATQTLALLPGSIALNAAGAGATTTDQRGLTTVGDRDLGAFESQGFTLTAGTGSTPQSTTVNQNFANPLSVNVTANNPDEPVANGIITLTAPTTGAGMNGTTVQTATINGNGVADFAARANTISGSYIVTATAAGVTSNVEFNLTNLADAIANIAINTGNNQSTVVNTNFANGLTLTATDQFGNLVPNAKINLSAPSTGASLATSSFSLTTDSLGRASSQLTANTIAGGFTVRVTGDSASNSLTLTNLAGQPTRFTIVGGNNQSTVVNTNFGNNLTVDVFDQFGNPVPNAKINLTAPGTGASLQTRNFSIITNNLGRASTGLTANTVAGSFNLALNSALGTASRTFALTNLADAIAHLLITSGNNQSTVVNTNFTNVLTLIATDQFGNLVPNAKINLSAPSTGASLKTPGLSLTTNSLGRVSTLLTANTIAGGFTVRLTGNSASNSLTLTNLAGQPARFTIVSGNNQSTVVNTDFGNHLTVDVFDQFGNLVPNAKINLTAPGTGASLQDPSFSLVTNNLGRASTDLTANTVSGSFNLALASSLGTANGNLTLTNLADAIANIAINTGNNQSTIVNTPFANALALTATDQFGNVVPNAKIYLSAPGTGASMKTPSLSLTTNNQGRASTQLTANTIAGGFTMTLTGDATNSRLTLTNLAEQPSRFTIVSGNNQSTVVNTAFRDPLTVRVFDQYNNPVPNASVNVTLPDSGASLNTANLSLRTDRTGQASTDLTANTKAGTFDLDLNLPRTTVNESVTLSNVADQAAVILPVEGNNQITNVGEAFAAPLQVKVTDQYGNPIANFPVTFQVQQGRTGAIAILQNNTSTTDPNGIAKMPISANGIGGTYKIFANGQGLDSITFNLENKPLNENNCPPDCGSQPQEEAIAAPDKATAPTVNINTINQNITALSKEETFSAVEIEQTTEYTNYLGINPISPLTVDQAQGSLADLDLQTDTKTAYISLRFRPNDKSPQDQAQQTSTPVLPNPSVGLKASQPQEPKPITQARNTPSKRLDDSLEVVITTGNNDIVVKNLPITRGQLLELNKELLRVINRPEPIFQGRLYAATTALYQQTFAPLEETLQSFNIDNLLLSLGEDLRSVPWAALYDGKQYLVEKYSIGITPNLSLTDTTYRPLRNRGVLVMGASDFNLLDDLPAVPTEIEMVAEQFGVDKYFLNQDFTRENLLSARQQIAPGIIHLATHASFVGGNLDKSYIQLWGDERLAISEMGDLQWFTDPPVELLVLSACQTALGDATSDLGFGGLAVKSGVRSALASLWSVSDVGTLALMREFYRNLSDPQIRTKAQALQQAQIALIRGELRIQGNQLQGGGRSPYVIELPETSLETKTLELNHPFSWAAFTLIGSPW